MLLKSYKKEIFKPECNPNWVTVHCIAHLDQDISKALPYLNSVLGGFEYIKEPASVTFKSRGRLISVHGDKIAINSLKDEAEADKILEWLKREVNEAWENRDNIEPSYEGAPKPGIMEILKLLPKTNCRECGEATCMVFAVRVCEGIKDHNDCPQIGNDEKQRLGEYVSRFNFD